MERGRKLLLADDSVTIQKVIDLTFGDEGMQVEAVGDGEQALARLEEFMPDIVLADVFMPKMSGYQVCEQIKRDERFRHIPVMLLVGSFEPFDEAEARRVGADDYLTKPFQSIRELISKVSGLLGGGRDKSEAEAQEADTRELPDEEQASHHEARQLTPEEIEVTTADTKRLPQDMVEETGSVPEMDEEHARAHSRFDVDTVENEPIPVSARAEEEQVAADWELASVSEQAREFQPQEIVTAGMNVEHTAGAYAGANAADDALLDLDFGGRPSAAIFSDDDILGLSEFEPAQVAEPQGMEAAAAQASDFVEAPVEEPREEFTGVEESAAYAHEPFEAERVSETGFALMEEHGAASSAQPTEPQAAAHGQITLDQLSPEAIDAIARRAVELLSAQVVEQVAWEVVPQLAELLIKRRLEEERAK